MNSNVALLICALLVMVGRVFITPRLNVPSIEGGFESAAHILAGVLLGMWLQLRKPLEGPEPKAFCLFLFWTISLWELGWFIFQKWIVNLL